MKFDILSVRDPVWANAQHTVINCRIRTSAFSEELPFTANPNDPEAHGREIFRRCVRGEFGEVGPYSPPQREEYDNTLVSPPKWAMAWPEVHDFLTEANVENTRNSPRAIGLVWGSMLETMLNSFIENQLKLQEREADSLKYSNGRRCGNSFEGRIKGAMSEGMIGSDLSDHLHAIRRIRNICAHEWRLDYDNQKVKELVDDFTLLKSAYLPTFLLDDFESLIKMVFSASCCRIIICLAERSVPEDVVANGFAN